MKKLYRVLFIFLFCFLIRLIYWSIWNKLHSPLEIPDTLQYIELGRNFIEKGEFMLEGIPTSKRPPLYPIYLGICYKIFKTNYPAWTFIQVIISCLSGVILFFVVKNLFGTLSATISFFLYAIDPIMIFRIPQITTEPLFVFLVILLILILILEERYKTKLFQVLAGIFLMLPALCRAEGIALVIFFPIFFFLTKKINQSTIQRFLLIFSFSILTILPWWIRNYRVHKQFILVSTHGGLSFLGDSGAHQLKQEGYWKFLESYFPSTPKKILERETYYEKIYYKKKIQHILEYPLDLFKIIIKNFLILHYFTSFPQSNRFDPVYGFILCFTFIGIFFLVKKGKEYPFKFLIYYLFMVYFGFALIYSFYTSDPRMRNSIEPILIILASYGLNSIFEKVNKKVAIFILGLTISINMLLFFTFSNQVRPLLLKFLGSIIGFSV